jgi:hypothetical protein
MYTCGLAQSRRPGLSLRVSPIPPPAKNRVEPAGLGVIEFAAARKAIVDIGSRYPLWIDQAGSTMEVFTEVGVVDSLLEDWELLLTDCDSQQCLLPAQCARRSHRDSNKGGA